jgi:hypothetical protein
MADAPYNGYRYKRFLRDLAANPGVCWICGAPGARSADHVPALAMHRWTHVEGSGCCELRASHRSCNFSQGAQLGNAMKLGQPVSVTAQPSGSW